MKSLLVFIAMAALFSCVLAKPADPATVATGAAAQANAAANEGAAAVSDAGGAGAGPLGAGAPTNPASAAANVAKGMAEKATGASKQFNPLSMMQTFAEIPQKAMDSFKTFF